MYIILILFFASLVSITAMIGRKLMLLRNGEAVMEDVDIVPGFPYAQEWRKVAVRGAQKYAHLTIVITLRIYIRSKNLLKDKYNEIKTRIANTLKKGRINGEKKEISKFLKIISDYKRKIRDIKHKIHEEEKNL